MSAKYRTKFNVTFYLYTVYKITNDPPSGMWDTPKGMLSLQLTWVWPPERTFTDQH